MCLNVKFLVICLIVYAIFQIYQICSSFATVFITEGDYYNKNKKYLTAFHITGMAISSVLLVAGALKLKANYLIGALAYLLYKLGFIIWHLDGFYRVTFGCDAKVNCPSNRLPIIYQHFLIAGS